MGFFTAIKTVLSGSKGLDLAEKGMDNLFAGIDKIAFTAEEKADMALKITEAAVRMVESTHGENTVRSMTRRIMAILIMGPFVGLILFAAGIWYFVPEWADTALLCADMLSNLALAVGIFYFGYYGVKQVFKK